MVNIAPPRMAGEKPPRGKANLTPMVQSFLFDIYAVVLALNATIWYYIDALRAKGGYVHA